MSKNRCCESETTRNLAFLALRVIVGGLFLYHGWLKLGDIAQTTGFFTQLNWPAPVFFAWLAGLLELVGGGLLVLGVWSRLVALVLGVEMVVAILFVHLGGPFAQAELAIALLAGLAGIKGAGGGKWRLTKDECACEMKK